MISIVYCTREPNPKHSEHLIKSSGFSNKGVEVIEVVNNGESLTKCYNRGFKQAKHDIIVFCHDDIILNKDGWGKKLIRHFNNTDYGILGMAGTTNLHESGRWWTDNTKMVGIVKHSNKGKTWENRYSSNFGKDILETVIVDGLFFAVHKDRVKVDFDETVEGFHFYEIDYCFRNRLEGVKIGVMFDIKITHKSIGQTNEEWDKNRVAFIRKYSDSLPLNIIPEINHKNKEVKLKETPKVSVIIPTKGKTDLLFSCIDSIYEKDDYSNLEIKVADTGSNNNDLKLIKDYISKHKSDRVIDLIKYDYYNYAKINNDVANNHVGDDTELLLFCNNDIELLNNAITQMVSTYLRNKKTTGTIGCRLHYENKTIQHSGIIMFVVDNTGNFTLSHKGLRSYHSYHLGTTNVLGNTAAFMLTPKSLFNQIGGFNEDYLECFEDVEYNIECLTRQRKNMFVGEAAGYHYESQSRSEDGDKHSREETDLKTRLIPKIKATPITWDYFDNVKRKVYESLMLSKVNG